MSDIQNTTGFSLADLAGMETDEIRAITSLVPAAGNFGVEVLAVRLAERDKKEGINPKTGLEYPNLFFVEFKYKILSAEPLDRNVDGEALLNRTLNDQFTIWPDQMAEMIGLLKGRYKAAGLDNSGRLGGVEGGEPGWLDGAVGAIIGLRIKHSPIKGSDDVRANFNWFALNPEEDAAA